MTIKTVLAAFTVLSAASVQAATIDTFSGEQLTSDVPSTPPPSDFSEVASGSVLGGARDVEAISDAGGHDQVTANVQFGGFSVSNASSGLGSGTLTYDGVDGSRIVSTAGLGGLDITTGINGAFAFDILTNDLSWD